jgi:hypothetical protein
VNKIDFENRKNIPQVWNIRTIKDNPMFPFVLIENWYTPEEEKAVWKELEYYSSNPIDRAEGGIVARDEDGKEKGKHYRFYLDKIYSQQGREQSNILNFTYKQKMLELHHKINECGHYGRSFFSSKSITSFVSYYENNDFYNSHYDSYHWTNLVWFVKEPKKFEGGDLIFEESNTKITLKHNRAIMFPSMFLHKSTPIKFNQQSNGSEGKFTITHFYYAD